MEKGILITVFLNVNILGEKEVTFKQLLILIVVCCICYMQKYIPTVATCTIVALLVMEILALALAVVLNVAALAVGHKHSSPFDSLRHERAKVKLGK